MFQTIFSFELKRWFKNWTFYLYLTVFFVIGLLGMASSVGVFDNFTITADSRAYANSAVALNSLLNAFSSVIFFLLPTIIGASIYRDFKYNMHSILYSYPFSKADYLFGKFLSSLFVTIVISLAVGIGAFIATILPWANEQLIGPNNILVYIQVYLLSVIPNLILYGSIVFVVVTLSRNVYVGFIVVIFLLVLQGLIGNLASVMDNRFMSALLDPFGSRAFHYYTKYWTIAEQNTNLLPFKGVVIYNRLIWLAVSGLFLAFLFYKFEFSFTALTFGRKRKKERIITDKSELKTRVISPKRHFNFSFTQNLKNVWSFSNIDFRYIFKNWVFISIIVVGTLFIVLSASSLGQIFGTKTYPVTWQMLMIPGGTFKFFILLLTFLFAGLITHRGSISKMNFLIDVSPTPNWVLFLSKFIALIKMQFVLLWVIVFSGMAIQIYRGYYNFEIGQYLFELFVLNWIEYMIWTFLALFIQTIFKNYLLGFFALLAIYMGMPFLNKIGIEQEIFYFNSDTGFGYSDMNKYGADLSSYFIYKVYWLSFGIFLGGMTLLFWRRGIISGLKERLFWVKKRMTPSVMIPSTIAIVAMLAIGISIYYENNITNPYYSAKDMELQRVEWERLYKKYEHSLQPRIVDVYVDVQLFPETRDFVANGTYVLKNKSTQPIDTLLINYTDFITTFDLPNVELITKDTIYNFTIYKLQQTLQPGDSLTMKFEVKNKPNTLLTTNSPVLNNGTFINNMIFPNFGYSSNIELIDDEVRKKYGLPPKERMAEQTDTLALQNTYISNDSDWIRFETTVSTSEDQIAIAPGYLEREWVENGRRYFHYKMDQKMLNFYAYNSARYEVKKDKWNDVNIEIYYHKGHEYNLDRMILSIKNSLDYYSENYSPYQHKQVRIIEFPRTKGSFAQSFANTIPFSETIGFIAEVDESNDDSVDYPFSVISHEVAHQWWAHQVIGADVQGATVLSESLAEYSSLKVLEHRYGKGQMRKFLKEALDRYLGGRTFERKKEKALMYNENQQYIHYSKGSLVLYMLSDYIGEKRMNDALKDYVKEVAFQEAPYTTASELVYHLEKATPDSLKYIIKDMFETITLYDNYVDKVSSKKLNNGKYEVTIDAVVSKYRSDEEGKRLYQDGDGATLTAESKKQGKVNSLPLRDYIEIGVFAKDPDTKKEKVLYLEKHKITDINTKLIIEVDELPAEVGVDPYNKLIDTNSIDNREKL